MLIIYGSPLSSPTNKVRYVANYLGIPYELQRINLTAGEHRQTEFLQVNPLGRIPAINDEGFTLGESNAIMRYLADKQQSTLYPHTLQERAIVDEWIDFAAQHISTATSKIMHNTHFYKFKQLLPDERIIQENHQHLAHDLPRVEQQLARSVYLAASHITLADIAMLAALDVCELAQVDLTVYHCLHSWRSRLMQQPFYTACHESYHQLFQQFLKKLATDTATTN